MDGGEMGYRESSHYYSTKFMRNSKAVGVLWGILSVCYAIIAIVVFMQVWVGIFNLCEYGYQYVLYYKSTSAFLMGW